MTFEELLQDPNVLYVYETGLQIYGLFEGVDRREFLVIHNDGLKPEIESTREKEYSFKRISDWFQEVCVVHFDRVRVLGVRDRARADHHVPRADGCGAAGAVHPVHGLRDKAGRLPGVQGAADGFI